MAPRRPEQEGETVNVRLLMVAGMAAALVGVPVGAASAGGRTTSRDSATSCTASADLRLPGNVLILSQDDTERHPVLITSCPLTAASLTVLSSTNEQADFIAWGQDPVVSGDTANWAEYAFNYVPGRTYHTDQSSYGLYDDPDGNLDQVTIATHSFMVKDATYATLKSVTRLKRTTTIVGTTRQWVQGIAGLGAVEYHAERVIVERRRGSAWLAVKTATSSAAGKLSVKLPTGTKYIYRLVVPSTSSLETSLPPPTSPVPLPSTPTTVAPPTTPPTTVPATTTTTTDPGCYPLDSEGNCYEPGEYCPTADHGMTGIAGDGKQITCEDNNGWRWEPT